MITTTILEQEQQISTTSHMVLFENTELDFDKEYKLRILRFKIKESCLNPGVYHKC